MGFWWRKAARDGQEDSRATGYEPEKEGISGNGKEPREVPGALLKSAVSLLDSLGENVRDYAGLATLKPDVNSLGTVWKADGIADGSCPISPNADAGVNGRG